MFYKAQDFIRSAPSETESARERVLSAESEGKIQEQHLQLSTSQNSLNEAYSHSWISVHWEKYPRGVGIASLIIEFMKNEVGQP